MRLGTDTGSLMNHMMASTADAAVDMPATMLGWTDRYAGTVVEVSRTHIAVQQDNATRADSNGMSDAQSYTYTRNPEGAIHLFKRDRKGEWRECCRNESGRLVFREGGFCLSLGSRRQFYDFSF